jgi:sterol desaturase/sphingolipid hydroxylase (fatty acid hydroxylase superfamily)
MDSVVSRMIASTHPFQLAVMGMFLVVDLVCLVWINRIKQAQAAAADDKNNKNKRPAEYSWELRRNACWACMATTVSIATVLDLFFPIDGGYMGGIKAYLFAFPLGLLDLYFSNTDGVSYQVVAGACLWCSCTLLRQLAINTYFEGDTSPNTVTELLLATLSTELVRYVCNLMGVGLTPDLFFSPLHRLTHHPKIYQHHHKEHHTYTNNLTSLVLYHGTLLDDFLMPFTTTIGGFLYVYGLSWWGLQGQAYSNLVGYLILQNTLLSHAHDIRCARLLAPLPDALNFVAYHFCHHLSPSNNFGLTELSDRLWDWILGVDTIVKYDDLV